MAQLLQPPTNNGLQKEIGATLSTGVTSSVTLNNTTGIQDAPGVIVVDRVDSNNETTPTKREFIEYTGVSGSTLTGLTRGLGGSTDQEHAVGAIVEFIPDVTVFQRIVDALGKTVDLDTGNLLANIATLSSTQTFSGVKTFTGDVNVRSVVERTAKVHDNGNSGATATINLNNGETQKIVITANTTLTFTNFAAGDYLTLFMDMNGTGGYTVAITASGVTFKSDGTTLETGANVTNEVGIRWVSATNARVFVRPSINTITTLT